MATPFGSFATGLVQAQERQRKQQQEDADRKERAEMAKLQRDALMSGMQEKKDAKALQQTRLGQRVSTLRRQPQFADYGDDELAGIASDDAAYQKLLMESLSPKTAARDPVADYLAKRKIDIENPLQTGPKPPVMGSPEWLAARDAEMTLQDKHRPPPRPPAERQPRARTEFQQKIGIVLPNAESAAKRLGSFIDQNGTVPLRTEIGKYKIGQYGLSADEQQFRAAAEMLLAAILRPETGAAVTDEEWQKYSRVFIPMPGDKPPLVKQKLEEVERRLGSMRGAMDTGPAQPGGDNPAKPKAKATGGAAAKYGITPSRP